MMKWVAMKTTKVAPTEDMVLGACPAHQKRISPVLTTMLPSTFNASTEMVILLDAIVPRHFPHHSFEAVSSKAKVVLVKKVHKYILSVACHLEISKQCNTPSMRK
jgi:hypothetical protein